MSQNSSQTIFFYNFVCSNVLSTLLLLTNQHHNICIYDAIIWVFIYYCMYKNCIYILYMHVFAQTVLMQIMYSFIFALFWFLKKIIYI